MWTRIEGAEGAAAAALRSLHYAAADSALHVLLRFHPPVQRYLSCTASLEYPQALGNPTMDVRTLPAMEGLDLFADCFQLATFVCWDGGFKASCTDDTRQTSRIRQPLTITPEAVRGGIGNASATCAPVNHSRHGTAPAQALPAAGMST